MNVIGKLVTRHFRRPLHLSLFTNKQRTHSIISYKKSLDKFNLTQKYLRSNLCIRSRLLCTVKRQVEIMGALSPLDPSSFSRPEQALIKHVNLEYEVDFEKKVLNGAAVLTIEVLDYIEDVILDTSDLDIKSIELKDGTSLKYKLDNPVPNYGSKLTITLPQSAAPEQKSIPTTKNRFVKEKEDSVRDPTIKIAMTFTGFMYKPRYPYFPTTDIEETCDSTEPEHISNTCIELKTLLSNVPSEFFLRQNMLQIKVKYSTSPNATALQWLDANQTSGKKYPYLFSQCQPIHARSILPCQDTPAVKFTYEAEVTAPEEFTVLMSAIRGKARASKTIFSQPVPIPSYLLALAIGVLESRKLGPRSHVWSEKEEIERSAWEFADTETYLQAAEQLCGPYQWTQYDLLVLPPSFPYGGMENPCLTFVTPTLLAGDRSQADVIIHEIMHSWTGNLVTNRNFEHFWLNEGFTVFLERKVAASLITDPKKSSKSRDFESLLGLQELSETINSDLGADNPLTKLVPDLDNTHPDDSFSRVPYEKGSLFLRYLEDLVGGAAIFDDFLRSYLNHFQSKSLDTDQFKEYLLNYFKDNEKLSQVDWETWLYKSGMPPIIPDYDTSMTKSVNILLSKINEPNATFEYIDIGSFSPHQKINLLQALIDQQPLSIEKLRNLGKTYKINESKNTEIIYRWLRLCIRSKDEEKVNDALTFVNQQGRMKYVRPIYRDLYAWEEVRERAIENFLKNEPYMMHVSAYTLKKDLHLGESEILQK